MDIAETHSRAVGLAETVARRMAPSADWTDMAYGDHFVQFYESDAYLVNEIAEYVIHGLQGTDDCIVAASAPHLKEIEILLRAFHPDFDGVVAKNRYIPLDADETLTSFMVGGQPVAHLFDKYVGSIVERSADRGSGIRVFGEMVGVLCCNGHYNEAVAVEEMWNELRTRCKFSLYCAYPLNKLVHENAADYMSAICGCHGNVLPSESYSRISNVNERLRAIAMLQQKSKQLEAELAELERRIAARPGDFAYPSTV